jgi:hypothetical protein
MNTIIEKVSKDSPMGKTMSSVGKTISKALLRLKKEAPKKGVNLLDITKKISAKKFGKKS